MGPMPNATSHTWTPQKKRKTNSTQPSKKPYHKKNLLKHLKISQQKQNKREYEKSSLQNL
jgi:hypothetical protein